MKIEKTKEEKGEKTMKETLKFAETNAGNMMIVTNDENDTCQVYTEKNAGMFSTVAEAKEMIELFKNDEFDYTSAGWEFFENVNEVMDDVENEYTPEEWLKKLAEEE